MKTKKNKTRFNGLFFWSKKKKTETEKKEEFKQMISEVARISVDTPNIVVGSSIGETIGRLYDFYQNYNQTIERPYIDSGKEPTDERIPVTPLSVMNELETVPTPFTTENLDEKIATLKDKTKLTNQRYAVEQMEALIKCLENRRKYQEFYDFYSKFPNTTDLNIENLLVKYKLQMNFSDLFVPTFPNEAIEVMKEYTEVTKKVTGKSPVFYVIAEPTDFKKKAKKLDPILLAQSPFGFYWQILGAWDKEMLLLSEL